ncbi:MAG: hypothetical protein EPO40_05850 [Myxococcaceae bacterium]|nr:MAG: hypothetical protein EPO40_05850 [Myxococcaceae bacterium]
MKTRSLRRLLTTVLMSTLPMTAVGCAETASSADGSVPDAGSDVQPTPTDTAVDAPLDRPIDVTTDLGTDAPADVSIDVPPDRNCSMCGCDFTGRLEGLGPLRAEHCVGALEDAGDATDASVDGGGPDPATCEIDCNRACQSVSVSGMGIYRPWGNGGLPGGGAPGTCQRASATEVSCVAYVPCGRRTDGQRDLDPGPGVADYLVRAAFLEAQSVGAFERMAIELRAHGAPAGLVRGAERSAREERAHARAMAALCESRGAAVTEAEEAPTSVRDLRAVAMENAVEGCARETWGALLALHQSTRAGDADVRAAMGEIARDEVRHAALSWALHRWAMARLDATERREVMAALEGAWDELESTLSFAPPAAVVGPLGLPDAASALPLARALRAELAA